MNRDDTTLALSAFLEGRAPLPEALVWLADHAELALLARLCHKSPNRALVAASAFIEALGPSQTATPPTPPTPPTPVPASPAAPLSLTHAFAHAEDAAVRMLALEEDIARVAPWLGIGWHLEGSVLRSVVADRLHELEAVLARSAELRRIADFVGRIDAMTRRGPNLERGGRESIIGVATSGELADVLPSELALLSDPDTEDLFLLRMAERNLLALEHDGATFGIPNEPVRRGHAIVCVDTSGSMIGDQEVYAKAATLALVKRVVGNGRRVEVAIFGGRGSITTIAFPGRGLRPLFDLMMTSYHGGTDFDGVLAWALRRRDALPGADIVMLSDGRGRVSPPTLRRIDAARSGPRALRVVYVALAPALAGVHDALAVIADEVVPLKPIAAANQPRG